MTRLAIDDAPPPFRNLAEARAHYRQVSARLQHARAPEVEAPPAASVEAAPRPVLRNDVPALAIGGANVVVVRALVAVATGKVDGPLVICGPAGSGKSHHAALARAICSNVHVVDESDGNPPADRTRLILFSEVPPAQIVSEAMRRACRGAAVLRLGCFDTALAATVARMMIGRIRLRMPGFGLAPEVIARVATGAIDGHVLSGRLRSLALHGAGPSTTTEVAGQMLPEIGSIPARPTIKTILAFVARRYGVSLKDLKSQRRATRLVRARQITMALAHRLTAHSSAEIGRVLERDHTSVLHGIRSIAIRIECDPELQAELLELEGQILLQHGGGAGGD